jgi:hypothetical protein
MTSKNVVTDLMGSGGNHGSPPPTDFNSCVSKCSSYRNGKGCNTVVYCNNPSGCGEGCTNDGFGPFGPPDAKCTADGKYPYKMCSLKWNADINAPEVYEEQSADWLSLTTANGFPRQQ